mmetsp:Transcript_17216/g.20741  ORF Transcript_17216/g.20741 Transcript_17216/m.20741 type:complete len:105 (+) Transcript_17216:156-470(+)
MTVNSNHSNTGFFKVAKETGAHIIPVGMWGNQYLFPPGNQYGTASPGTVHAAIGNAVNPEDFDTVEELCEHVRGEILRLRNGLPNYKKEKEGNVGGGEIKHYTV